MSTSSLGLGVRVPAARSSTDHRLRNMFGLPARALPAFGWFLYGRRHRCHSPSGVYPCGYCDRIPGTHRRTSTINPRDATNVALYMVPVLFPQDLRRIDASDALHDLQCVSVELPRLNPGINAVRCRSFRTLQPVAVPACSWLSSPAEQARWYGYASCGECDERMH
jgi:hypothetical protein